VNDFIIALAGMLALAMAVSDSATAVRQPSQEIVDIFTYDQNNIVLVLEYEGPAGGCSFADEACYVVVHDDLTMEVGP
jgi:hypothetical protein